jgi:hypothetical protein
MEFAAATTALAVLIILQIATLYMVARSIKLLNTVVENLQQRNARRSERKPRERRDNRRSRNRPQQDSNKKSAQSEKSAPSAPKFEGVDKSLREINLRLKSAERDQEKARKQVTDGNGQQGRRRKNRSNRRRDDRRQQNDQPVENARNESRAPTATEHENAPVKGPENKPEPRREKQHAEEKVETATKTVATETRVEEAARDENDNLEHGRRFSVKRRALKVDEESSEGASSDQQSNGDQQSAPEQGEFSSQRDSEEVSYGRRSG